LNRIAVIDAVDGGIGSSIIKAIRQVIARDTEIRAMGANADATAQMVKSGAHHGITGESAICQGVRDAYLIVGSLSILICHAMMGEITPRMVDAVGSARAPKILLPVTDKPGRVDGTV
jgi:hypothetical protein